MADTVEDLRNKLRKTYSDFGVRVSLEGKGSRKRDPEVMQPQQPPKPQSKFMPEERLTYNPAGTTATVLDEIPKEKRVRARGLIKTTQAIMHMLNLGVVPPYVTVHPSGEDISGKVTITVQAELRLDKFRKPYAWARWLLLEHQAHSIIVRWWGHRFWVLSLAKSYPESVVVETATFRDEWGKLVPTPTNVAHAIKKTVARWLDNA